MIMQPCTTASSHAHPRPERLAKGFAKEGYSQVGHVIRFCILPLTFILVGCASTHSPQDSFEGFNRAMFSFNDKFDQAALIPAARAYQMLLPAFVQNGVGNFFGNINDVPTACNNLMQGRIPDGMSDLMRVLVNTTIGLGGVLDVATDFGMQRHDQDFGQTLGRWGVKPGPYVVLPLLGPTTLRDAAAMPIDLTMDPVGKVYPVLMRNIGSSIRVVDRRAYMLVSSSLIEDAALDKYEFVRDAYMQRRQNKIYLTDPPWSSPDDDGCIAPKSFETDAKSSR